MPTLKRPRGANDIQEVPRLKADIPETFGSGRRCRICSSALSQYNPNPECWSHSYVEDRIEDLAALMQTA